MDIYDYANIYNNVEFGLADPIDDVNFDGPDIADTDWSEARCPVCNRLLDSHDSQRITRCAITEYNT